MATKRKTKIGRERIYGFSWTTNGVTQAIYENDCETRKDFLKERRWFKNHKIRIKDHKTRKPYRRA